MRKPLVAANWKMQGSRQFLVSYFDGFQKALSTELEQSVDIVLFPPFVYLAQAVKMLEQAAESVKYDCVGIGAQNLSQFASGAFTGEIAADMLADVGCRYVLVGHSERRSLYGESSQMVAEKFVAARNCGLTPVLCVGESLEERENDATLDVVNSQLKAVIDLAGLAAVTEAVIAYEPVWAIGTGRTASPEQAQEVHCAIRAMLADAGEKTRILYGGSVKAENAQALFAQPDIDGGLVGGASLDAGEFAAICKNAQPK
ncbi:MAG: triose-phosphate isomerase [Porticoccaceae bacterium]|nr:triose-phosphate isomerase [Porticoccaceae bacterium]